MQVSNISITKDFLRDHIKSPNDDMKQCLNDAKMIGYDAKKILAYAPKHPNHQVWFTLKNVNIGMANAIRTYLWSKVPIYSLHVNLEDFKISNQFVPNYTLVDAVKKTLQGVPLPQEFCSGLEVSLAEFKADNNTNGPMIATLKHIKVMDAKNQDVSPKLFHSVIPIAPIDPRQFIHVPLSIVQGTGIRDQNQFAHVEKVMYIPKDDEFKLGYRTFPLPDDPKRPIIKTCETMTADCEAYLKVLDTVSEVPFHSEEIIIVRKGEYHVFEFQHVNRIVYAIAGYCDVPFVNADNPHPLNNKINITIRHSDPINVIKSSIKKLTKDCEVLKAAFIAE